jgi:hypothetical protein
MKRKRSGINGELRGAVVACIQGFKELGISAERLAARAAREASSTPLVLVRAAGTRSIYSQQVAPREPEQVLVQQQLKSWLDPGWCMDAPAGSEAKANRAEGYVWYTTGIVLMFLWALGLVSNYTMGGLIHLLLVFAIGLVLHRRIQSRQPG